MNRENKRRIQRGKTLKSYSGHMNQKQIRKVKRKAISGFTKFVLASMVIAAAVCIILFGNKNVVSADESGNAIHLNKYYKTITIEPGDTLWTIAKEYKSGDYKNTKEYVDELKSMNGIHTDDITQGQKLVVAYFAE